MLEGSCIATDNACKLVTMTHLSIHNNSLIQYIEHFIFSLDTYEVNLKRSTMYIYILMSKSNITQSPDGNKLHVIGLSVV